MVLIKILYLSPGEVDASLFVENGRNRLLPRHHAPIKGLVDYVNALTNRLTESSQGTMTKIGIIQGFTVYNTRSRMYFRCEHNVKHVIYYENHDLRPGHRLKLNWEVKCTRCEARMPPEQPQHDIAPDLQQNQNVRLYVPQDPHVPIASNIRQNVANVCENRNFDLNIGYRQNEIGRKFDNVALKLKTILQDALAVCLEDPNPMQKAHDIRTEISVKFVEVYSDEFCNQQFKRERDEHAEDVEMQNYGLSTIASQSAHTAATNRLHQERPNVQRMLD